ncbi:Hypothetical predicted protein, partial [Marmota monax]
AGPAHLLSERSPPWLILVSSLGLSTLGRAAATQPVAPEQWNSVLWIWPQSQPGGAPQSSSSKDQLRTAEPLTHEEPGIPLAKGDR